MTLRVDAENRLPKKIRYGWPLYSADWETLFPDICASERWHSRALSQPFRSSIPQASGVYMMCVKPPSFETMREPFSDFHNVIYVGRSINLRQRYGRHLNAPSPKVRAARIAYANTLRFWFLEAPIDAISAFERVLIECFGPPANDKPGDHPALETGVPKTIGTQ